MHPTAPTAMAIEEDGLFKALVVGHGAQHRRTQGNEQRGDGGGIAPVGEIRLVVKAGGAGQIVKIDGMMVDTKSVKAELPTS